MVYVVDDDLAARKSQSHLSESKGLPFAAYGSAGEFLEKAPPIIPPA
jgi:FixJ family two-component response regulator